jgi:hypothetical protein
LLYPSHATTIYAGTSRRIDANQYPNPALAVDLGDGEDQALGLPVAWRKPGPKEKRKKEGLRNPPFDLDFLAGNFRRRIPARPKSDPEMPRPAKILSRSTALAAWRKSDGRSNAPDHTSFRSLPTP